MLFTFYLQLVAQKIKLVNLCEFELVLNLCEFELVWTCGAHVWVWRPVEWEYYWSQWYVQKCTNSNYCSTIDESVLFNVTVLGNFSLFEYSNGWMASILIGEEINGKIGWTDFKWSSAKLLLIEIVKFTGISLSQNRNKSYFFLKNNLLLNHLDTFS